MLWRGSVYRLVLLLGMPIERAQTLSWAKELWSAFLAAQVAGNEMQVWTSSYVRFRTNAQNSSVATVAPQTSFQFARGLQPPGLIAKTVITWQL